MKHATRRLAFVMAASLCAAAARSQPSAATPTPTVAPLVISGGPAPKLISSFPADGATVAAGVTALTLKFDRPIAEKPSLRTLSVESGASAPPCLAQPRELDDGKTLVILCATRPGKAYEIALGPGSGLVGANDKFIPSAHLHFATNETIIDNIPGALEAAGLPVDADPVMGWREVGGPDTSSPGTLPPSESPAAPAAKGSTHD
jgi:hypothetical protein